MAPHSTIEPQDEFQSLTYLKWQDLYNEVKPYQVLMDVPMGVPRTNLVFQQGPEEHIQDVRGREHEFNLDDHGFTLRRHVFETDEFEKESIEARYLPEVAAMLEREVPGADEVFCFNWQVRTADRTKTDKVPGSQIYLDDSMQWITPVSYVHVDQTPGATEQRIRHHMGDRADELLRGRYRIINVWRPLKYTVEDQPLAFGDGSAVTIEDCVGVDHIRRYYVGESNYPLFNPGYRWFYLNRQTKDEVLIFKTHDSDTTVKAMCCPHTSFRKTQVPEDYVPRESIEVRALVFTKC